MNIFSLKPHPYSEMFPTETTGSGFSELVASIKKLGRIRNAIIIYQNQILDGNRRLRACKIAKVGPRHIEFKGTDAEALEVVWDLNYNRRDLTPSARSVAFAKYCNFADHGRMPENQSGNVTTLTEAAERAGVSKTTMQYAKKVVQHGTERDIKNIQTGKATVSEVAAKIRKGGSVGSEDNPRDDGGFLVPKPAMACWDRKGEAEEILATLRAAKKKVNALDKKDLMWIEVNLGGVLSDLESAINRFRGGVAAHVCAHCQGQHPEKCTACKGRGCVSNFFWKHAVPHELKKMRKAYLEERK